MSVLSKLIRKFNAIPIKITAAYFWELDKLILKCIQKNKNLQTAKVILTKEDKQIHLSDIKTYYKVISRQCCAGKGIDIYQ